MDYSKWLVVEYGYIQQNDGYVGKCHLCVDVRKHLIKYSDFDELRPKEFYFDETFVSES